MLERAAEREGEEIYPFQMLVHSLRWLQPGAELGQSQESGGGRDQGLGSPATSSDLDWGGIARTGTSGKGDTCAQYPLSAP